MDARWESDEAFADRLQAAHLRYAAQRDADLPPGASHGPSGGVAGSRRGVKCLHAHYADHLAGNDNPVGEWTAPQVEPLDCEAPCVLALPGGPALNPDWRAGR